MQNRENEIATDIVDSAFKIHVALGPGLLETVYAVVLERDLTRRGHHVVREKQISIQYDGMTFDEGFRADLIVDDLIIVELKSVEAVKLVHKKQLLTYLRLADKRLGLRINFGELHIKDGISRVVNGLPD